jgi:predicted acyl esterase
VRFNFGTPDGYEFLLKAGTLQNLSKLLGGQQELWLDQVHHDTNDDYCDEYISDPNKPVPFVSYVAQTVPREYMVSDQRFAASRNDVVTYQTDVFQEDVAIVGPVSLHLFVSTIGTDSDWDVKVIDVYPPDCPESKLDAPRPEDRNTRPTDVAPPTFIRGGHEQLVRGEAFRGKLRHSFEKPIPSLPTELKKSLSPCKT